MIKSDEECSKEYFNPQGYTVYDRSTMICASASVSICDKLSS